MNDLENALPTALVGLGRHAPHESDLAGLVRRRVRRRRIATAGPIAAVLAVVLVLGSIWAGQPGRPSKVAAVPSACSALLTSTPPQWAQAGFSGPGFAPFAFSASGNLIAYVFVPPLVSPPAADHHNKILWVTKSAPLNAGEFTIVGQLEGSNRTVTVDVGLSPGPSIVDMPAPGCWHLSLKWGNTTDSIDLRWQAG
ncbi:MAG: hypothetical protein M3Z00_10045 [Actinomycetota bacterium]|nr:hypothetical protein [Actinomycetota bacterium]